MSGRIPPPTQALNSATFVPPPLDLSLTTAELIDFRRTHSPYHIVYVYDGILGGANRLTFRMSASDPSCWTLCPKCFPTPETANRRREAGSSVLANSGESDLLVVSCFITLTCGSLMSRWDHAFHRPAWNNPRRGDRVHAFVKELCLCCGPPCQSDRKQAHCSHAGPQPTHK